MARKGPKTGTLSAAKPQRKSTRGTSNPDLAPLHDDIERELRRRSTRARRSSATHRETGCLRPTRPSAVEQSETKSEPSAVVASTTSSEPRDSSTSGQAVGDTEPTVTASSTTTATAPASDVAKAEDNAIADSAREENRLADPNSTIGVERHAAENVGELGWNEQNIEELDAEEQRLEHLEAQDPTRKRGREDGDDDEDEEEPEQNESDSKRARFHNETEIGATQSQTEELETETNALQAESPSTPGAPASVDDETKPEPSNTDLDAASDNNEGTSQPKSTLKPSAAAFLQEILATSGLPAELREEAEAIQNRSRTAPPESSIDHQITEVNPWASTAPLLRGWARQFNHEFDQWLSHPEGPLPTLASLIRPPQRYALAESTDHHDALELSATDAPVYPETTLPEDDIDSSYSSEGSLYSSDVPSEAQEDPQPESGALVPDETQVTSSGPRLASPPPTIQVSSPANDDENRAEEGGENDEVWRDLFSDT